jgi:DNA-binding CsgD family transcriptional regulator
MALLKPALLTALAVLIVKLFNTLLVYHFFSFEYYLAFVAVLFLLAGYLLSARLQSQNKEPSVPAIILNAENEALSRLKGIRFSLSNRELAVFRYVANGCTNKEIALNLGVEVSTVKTHINNLYTKIDCTSRKDAIEVWGKMVKNEILS